MEKQSIIRDERYTAVENASYRIGYMVLTFGLFALVIVRGIFFQDSAWDLLALNVLASLAATIYQARHKIIIFSWKWPLYVVAVGVLAAVVVYLLNPFLR